MGEPYELLGIAVTKLDLESGSVSSEYFLTSHRELCGEEKLVLLVWHNPYDKSHFPLHCLGVCEQSVSLAFQSLNVEFLHTEVVKLLVIDLSIDKLRASSFTGSWPGVEVSQIRIVSKSADEMESELSNAIHECRCGEISIGNHYISHFDEFLAVALDDSDVMLHQCLVPLFEL